MNNIHHGDGVLELGAQWIHGRGDCPLWKFVLVCFVCTQLPMMRVGMVMENLNLNGGNVGPKELLKQTLDFAKKVTKKEIILNIYIFFSAS